MGIFDNLARYPMDERLPDGRTIADAVGGVQQAQPQDKKSFLRGILGNFLFSLSQGLQASSNAAPGQEGMAGLAGSLQAPMVLDEMKRRRALENLQVQMQMQRMQQEQQQMELARQQADRQAQLFPVQRDLQAMQAANAYAESQQGQPAPVQTPGYQYPAEAATPPPVGEGKVPTQGMPYQNEIVQTYGKLPAVPTPGIPSLGIAPGQIQPQSREELQQQRVRDMIIAMRMAAEKESLTQRAKNIADLPFLEKKEEVKAKYRAPKHELLTPEEEAQQIRLRKASGQGAVDLTPEALDLAADLFSNTGQLPPSLGRGGQAQRMIMNRAAARTPNLDIATNKAAYKANEASLTQLQRNRDAVVSFENTALKNLDIFLKTAKDVVDSGSPLINTPLRIIDEKVLGSKELMAYQAARRVAINEIAKVTSNPNLSGQLSDSARREVENFIPENANLGQAYAVAKVLKQDMTNRHKSLDDQIEAIKTRISGSQAKPENLNMPKPEDFKNVPAGKGIKRNGRIFAFRNGVVEDVTP